MGCVAGCCSLRMLSCFHRKRRPWPYCQQFCMNVWHRKTQRCCQHTSLLTRSVTVKMALKIHEMKSEKYIKSFDPLFLTAKTRSVCVIISVGRADSGAGRSVWDVQSVADEAGVRAVWEQSPSAASQRHTPSDPWPSAQLWVPARHEELSGPSPGSLALWWVSAASLTVTQICFLRFLF